MLCYSTLSLIKVLPPTINIQYLQTPNLLLILRRLSEQAKAERLCWTLHNLTQLSPGCHSPLAQLPLATKFFPPPSTQTSVWVYNNHNPHFSTYISSAGCPTENQSDCSSISCRSKIARRRLIVYIHTVGLRCRPWQACAWRAHNLAGHISLQ